MSEILLSRGMTAQVDENDFERLARNKWYATTSGPDAYAMRRESVADKRITIWMHREIMHAGAAEVVDHRNGYRLDNRKRNLRVCTKGQNNRNTVARSGGASQYKGVYYRVGENPWIVRIKLDGRQTHLGCFADEMDAARAYDVAARQLHGDFARLNFPLDITGEGPYTVNKE